jgi:hypothetical protein
MRAANIARDLLECLQSLKDKVSSHTLQHELRYRYLTPVLDPSPLLTPHLPSSIPHELPTGQELTVYTEPLTVTIPSSSFLQQIMDGASHLPTPEQQGQHLKDLLQSEPVFLHTTFSLSPK